jgi:hypothetical protein
MNGEVELVGAFTDEQLLLHQRAPSGPDAISRLFSDTQRAHLASGERNFLVTADGLEELSNFADELTVITN